MKKGFTDGKVIPFPIALMAPITSNYASLKMREV
jgi:hypothetical protein